MLPSAIHHRSLCVSKLSTFSRRDPVNTSCIINCFKRKTPNSAKFSFFLVFFLHSLLTPFVLFSFSGQSLWKQNLHIFFCIFYIRTVILMLHKSGCFVLWSNVKGKKKLKQRNVIAGVWVARGCEVVVMQVSMLKHRDAEFWEFCVFFPRLHWGVLACYLFTVLIPAANPSPCPLLCLCRSEASGTLWICHCNPKAERRWFILVVVV